MNHKITLTTFIIGFLPAAVIVFLAAIQPWVMPDDLFRDTLEIAIDKAKTGDCCHAYYGMLSKLGALLWCATAAVCLFCTSVLLRRSGISMQALFMLSAALVTSMLLFDDFFLGHEVVFVKLFGIDQKVVFLGYGLIVLAYLFVFRKLIIECGYLLLFTSLMFFAISVFVDVFFEHGGLIRRVCEDGSKLLGITGWATFHVRAAWLLLSSETLHPPAP